MRALVIGGPRHGDWLSGPEDEVPASYQRRDFETHQGRTTLYVAPTLDELEIVRLLREMSWIKA